MTAPTEAPHPEEHRAAMRLEGWARALACCRPFETRPSGAPQGEGRSWIASRSLLLAVLLGLIATPASAQEGLRPYVVVRDAIPESLTGKPGDPARGRAIVANRTVGLDRKSTRLNSSHRCISYAVFCLKKKKHHPP